MSSTLQYIIAKLVQISILISKTVNSCRQPSNCKLPSTMPPYQKLTWLTLQTLLSAIFTLNLFESNGSLILNIFACFTSILLAIVQYYHRDQPLGLWTYLYNILIAAYGVHIALYTDGKGLLIAYLGVVAFPIFVYLITNNVSHFLIQSIIQILCLTVYYKARMTRLLVSMTSENLVGDLESSLYIVMIIIVVVTLMSYISHRPADCNEQETPNKDEFRAQRTFFMSFSHELRNLINSIMGHIKLARLEQNSEKVKEMLSNSEVCGELLLHLVNNILDRGKLEIGDLEFNPAPAKIYETVESVWRVCSELIQQKGLKGRMKIQKHMPKVLKIDHYRLTQIILNLTDNAVKFTQRGLVDVSVEWVSNMNKVSEKCFEPYPFNDENDQDEGLFEKSQALSVFDEKLMFLNSPFRRVSETTLDESGNRTKGILKVVVSDTGCGISKDDISELLEGSTQFRQNVQRRRLSTGLGLFITKKLCEKMGGELRIYSKEGKGSSFIVCIPVSPCVSQHRSFIQIESMKRIMSQKNLKAMVVDDTPFNNVILKNYFTKIGIDVVDTAENGEIAIEKYKSLTERETLNIVTMDIDMPVMDGKEAAQRIRDFEVENNIEPCLLVIVSGNCGEAEIEECLDQEGRVRADAFLKKPVSIEDLYKVMSFHFNERVCRSPKRHYTV